MTLPTDAGGRTPGGRTPGGRVGEDGEVADPRRPDVRPVATIGNFDGVHLGHRAVLDHAREVAGSGPLAVVTFDPHPLRVLRPDAAPLVLTPAPRKAGLLRAAGVDEVVVVPFTREVAAWSPQRFVDEVLVGRLRARAVVVGENFRFGRDAAGDVAQLRALGEERDLVVVPAPLASSDEPVDPVGGVPQRISSSLVRRLVASGDVAAAARLLGRPHRVSGPVVHGDERGRELGYPTANVDVAPDAAVPADGVYASWLTVDGTRYPALTSIGTNPTFAGTARRVEAWVLDRDDLDLYTRFADVDFVTRQRPTERFASVAELVVQMDADAALGRRLLLAGAGVPAGRPAGAFPLVT